MPSIAIASSVLWLREIGKLLAQLRRDEGYQSTGPFNKPTMTRTLEAQRAEECLQATNQ